MSPALLPTVTTLHPCCSYPPFLSQRDRAGSTSSWVKWTFAPDPWCSGVNNAPDAEHVSSWLYMDSVLRSSLRKKQLYTRPLRVHPCNSAILHFVLLLLQLYAVDEVLLKVKALAAS